VARTAALDASSRYIPTPMFVGREVVSEGEFGMAWVTVLDARQGFARWLLKHNEGHPGNRGGSQVFSPHHFVQRARVFAETFALVLRVNGIDCSVDSRLD